MSPPLQPLPPEESGLDLHRSGLRFVVPQTESDYVAWNREQSIPFIRIGCTTSAVSWVLLTLAAPSVVPTRWIAAVAPIWFGMAPLLVATYTATLRVGWRRALMPLAVTANAAAGLCLIWICHLAQLRELSVIATIVNSFVALTVFRLRPLAATLSVVGVIVLDEVWITLEWVAGTATTRIWVADTVALVTALQTGAFTCVLFDRVSRNSFRQERIIAAQRETIARERARSESLLKQELAHQVAERSRQLGAALARSDVTLDVRRLAPGERFDARYRIVAPLGAGGMGAVYEVERVTDGASLALKAVTGEVSGASAARFAREAEIGASIRHPNLVSIVDVGVSGGVPFLVMELVRGGSLEQRRERFGDPVWAMPILRQLAEGIAALHDAGVVHRDLKPANVLLAGTDAAPVAKISDFGISRFSEGQSSPSIDPTAPTLGATPSGGSPALTGTGVVMGTPLYMAPEAASGGRVVGAPADVFALGIIAYEMLSGRSPFAVPAVMLTMAGQPLPTPAALDDPRIPQPLRASVFACVVGDPTRRPTARSLAQTMA